MIHLDLFSGIGGFSIASDAVWPDVEHIFCEIDPFCKIILKKHYPDSKIYDDIKKLSGKEIGKVDLLTGGFPCQPFSQAGKRRGKEDDRHLWPEMLRIIKETTPKWIIGENVSGILTWNEGMVFEEVCSDLEREGYEVQAFAIPACAVNAPHKRERIWIIAHANSDEHRGRKGSSRKTNSVSSINRKEIFAGRSSRTDKNVHNPGSVGRRGGNYGDTSEYGRKIQTKGSSAAFHGWQEGWLEAATRLCTLDDGIPGKLARPRGWRNAALKGAGNAIVPQVAIEIMRAIYETNI